MKATQMPSVHAANLAANSGNTAYGVDVIMKISSGQLANSGCWLGMGVGVSRCVGGIKSLRA